MYSSSERLKILAYTKALESNKYCTVALLDISQAFDKLWHEGLPYKIKTFFPDSIDKILKSYLEDRYFS
jgi:hypothetical protein